MHTNRLWDSYQVYVQDRKANHCKALPAGGLINPASKVVVGAVMDMWLKSIE